MTKEIIHKLASVSNIEVPAKDPELEKLYTILCGTFNSFDNDGSGQLVYSEYEDERRFLGRSANSRKQILIFFNGQQFNVIRCSR